MPGAYYDSGLSSPQHTFADAPVELKAHKSLSAHHNYSLPLKSTDADRPSADIQDEQSSPGSDSLSSALLNGHEGGLPPTPPTNSRENEQNAGFSPPILVDGVMAPHKSAASTPTNQRSPPTPDDTPPASLVSPPRPIQSGLSSRAESFQTAREEQTQSSDDEDGLGRFGYHTAGDLALSSQYLFPLTPSAVSDSRYLQSLRPRLMQNGHTAIARGDGETEDDGSSTPTQGQSARRLNEITAENSPNTTEHIPNREWDTNLMRTVTVRPKRKLRHSLDSAVITIPKRPANEFRSRPLTNGDTTVAVPQPPIETSENVQPSPIRRHKREVSFSEDAKGEPRPRTPTSETSSLRDQFWPSPIRHMSAQYRSASDPKRISSISSTSTVIEAVIIPTPPKQRRALRHVSKTLSLRSEAGLAAGDFFEHTQGSPISPCSQDSPARRVSAESDGDPRRRLSHKRGSISEMADTPGSRNSVATISPVVVHQLRHPSDQQRVRAEPERASRIYASKPESDGTIDLARNVSARLPRSHPPRQKVIIHNPAEAVAETPVRHRRMASAPQRVQFSESEAFVTHEPQPTSGPSTTLTRSLTQRALVRAMPTTPPETTRYGALEQERPIIGIRDGKRRIVSEPVASPRAAERPRVGQTIINPAATNPATLTRATEIFKDSREPLKISKVVTTVTEDVYLTPARPHIQRITTGESIGGQSSSYSWSVDTNEHQRFSADRSTLRAEEHANARHLYAQTTPFSQFSDTPAELSEARAVSIYPHNNHSILVVQQDSQPTSAWTHSATSISEQEQPAIMVQPSTPPPPSPPSDPLAVDSPLRNPRKAPPLPAIKILPATPAEEFDSPILDQAVAPAPGQLVRRPTLAQRARRFSDTFVQPIFARTGSFRRNRHGNPGKRPATSGEGAPRDANLHPFWHPRGFWDDMTDSDSDFGDDGDGYAYDYEDGDDLDSRLPPGGDTSDVEDPQMPPRGITSRLIGGLGRSNSARFHVGNSLGLERHGTNRRKPRILAPTSLTRTSSGRVVRASESVASGSGSLRASYGGAGVADTGATALGESVQRNSRQRMWNGPRGLQIHWLGVSGIRDLVEEKMREKRRERIRRSIGPRLVLEDGPMSDV